MKTAILILSLLFSFYSIDLFSQKRNTKPISTSLFENISVRNIGPAKVSGRITKVVKDYTDKNTWYVTTASGNIWKTENNGTTWLPIFENYGSYSIGTITIDPKNPKIIWVGTGENNSQRSVGFGDGIYKSVDGGNSWKNMGLKTSEHIAKIIVDPEDSDNIFVASQGPLWRSGGQRGLYNSKDGGDSWQRILHVTDDTGISDVVMDHNDNNIMYASTYQRRRHFGILVAGGPEKPDGLKKGYFIKPTIFTNVSNNMRIAKEEIFGPVLSIIPFESEEEAIKITNDTSYGLGNYVQTENKDKARRVARKFRSGGVYINGNSSDPGTPFGGYRQSGNGREGGTWGLEEYLEVKTICGWK